VRLVDDLLEVSRITRGTLSLQTERVSLESIVQAALETSLPVINAGSHHLEVHLPDTPVWIEGDRVRLAQILSNLLNNAAKYSERGGRIAIDGAVDGETLTLSVADTGIGLSPEMIPRIFDMFSRGDRDSSYHQGGLGIGLALSRRLAAMHGGTIEARSDGLGHGSVFVMRLPVRAASHVPTQERAADEQRLSSAHPARRRQRRRGQQPRRHAAPAGRGRVAGRQRPGRARCVRGLRAGRRHPRHRNAAGERATTWRARCGPRA
jgi:two-component sensor histidine kinase